MINTATSRHHLLRRIRLQRIAKCFGVQIYVNHNTWGGSNTLNYMLMKPLERGKKLKFISSHCTIDGLKNKLAEMVATSNWFMTISQPVTRHGAKAENPARIPVIIDQTAIDEANKVYLNFVSCLNSIGAEPSILARLQDMVKNWRPFSFAASGEFARPTWTPWL